MFIKDLLKDFKQKIRGGEGREKELFNFNLPTTFFGFGNIYRII